MVLLDQLFELIQGTVEGLEDLVQLNHDNVLRMHQVMAKSGLHPAKTVPLSKWTGNSLLC